MHLECNISAFGRRLRGIAGTICLLLGAGWLTLGWPLVWWGILVGALLVLVGAFAIFEARSGWCALRALGIRTPL